MKKPSTDSADLLHWIKCQGSKGFDVVNEAKDSMRGPDLDKTWKQ